MIQVNLSTRYPTIHTEFLHFKISKLSSALDLNECELSTHNCAQTCVNTEPNFMCDCVDGYTVADDGYTCESGKRSSTFMTRNMKTK